MAALIDDIRRVVAESGQAGAGELESAITSALSRFGSGSTLVSRERLKPKVLRMSFELPGGDVRSLVVKRLYPAEGRRNELVIGRWLPELGFDGVGPALLGMAAEPTGRHVWQVYEDLGPWVLDAKQPDRERVTAVVRTIASLHARFAAHPILGEVRFHGEDHGPTFFSASVRDAIHGLEMLRPPRVNPTAEEAALRDRLLDRLRRLQAEEARRIEAFAVHGGPETFLHGDLWTTNTFVEPRENGARVRLIDWDHAGVGPASYDLSTFLLRFAPEHRAGIVDVYRQAIGEHGLTWPGREELNLAFETAECARYASRAVWPAIALLRERATWGFEELGRVAGWFDALRPVLPGTA